MNDPQTGGTIVEDNNNQTGSLASGALFILGQLPRYFCKVIGDCPSARLRLISAECTRHAVDVMDRLEANQTVLR